MRAALLLLVVLTSGCIENMDELKVALGAKQPPAAVPEPVYLPPVAKAQANLTSLDVGASVRFTSEGTRDAQGLALTFRWDFSDGESGEGPVVEHRFSRAGDHAVTLTVTNSAGLTDTAHVTLHVSPANRAPVASFVVRTPSGAPTTSAEQGGRLTFDAGDSRDADGDALGHLWTFGDGATSFEAKPQHAYEKPGLYTVRLKVDDGRLSHETSRLLAINGTTDIRAEFTVAGGAAQKHALHVAEGAQILTVTLTFDANLGSNDLTLRIRDAAGAAVAHTTDTTPPGAQGTQTRTITLAYDALALLESGEWTLDVERTKGVQVAYRVVARQTF